MSGRDDDLQVGDSAAFDLLEMLFQTGDHFVVFSRGELCAKFV
jgi:hypothetical protein